MRSKDREMIKLFVAGMIFQSWCDWSIAASPRTTAETLNSTQNGYSTITATPKTTVETRSSTQNDLDPVANICQNIFDDYTSVKYQLQKIKKKLGGVRLNHRWSLKFSKKQREEICSTTKNMLSMILDSPRVMLCTQRVHNFMTNYRVLYYPLINNCKLQDRWTDMICGNKWVFEKCIGQRMLATLRNLNEPRNSDKCQMCKEAPNLKMCAEKAGLCRNLTDILYPYHRDSVAALQCDKCPGILDDWNTTYTRKPQAETCDNGPDIAAILAGVACIVVLGVLLGIAYIRFRRAKSARELTYRESSTPIPASKTSFTVSKRETKILELLAAENSSTKTTIPSFKPDDKKSQRRDRSKRRKSRK